VIAKDSKGTEVTHDITSSVRSIDAVFARLIRSTKSTATKAAVLVAKFEKLISGPRIAPWQRTSRISARADSSGVYKNTFKGKMHTDEQQTHIEDYLMLERSEEAGRTRSGVICCSNNDNWVACQLPGLS
jgi:hypothetical protein